jgi:hypothetical protein
MGVSLDLRKAHLSRQHGDILAIYTWVNDERALVLMPAFRPGAPWYIVCESAAFRYDDAAYLARQCAKACEVLGMEPSRANWVRLASIIHEGLPDLIRMPSAPPAEYLRPAFGSMELRADGQVLAGEDIRVEREGATYG